MRSWLIAIWVISSWTTVQAKNRITDVVFESGQDVASFLLVTTHPVTPEQVETLADGDPSVLMVRFSAAKVRRKWVDVKDKLIKRALIHPSKEKSGASVLRIRFFDKRVNNELMKSVRIVAEDAGIRVDIPRSNAAPKKPDQQSEALSPEALQKAMAAYASTGTDAAANQKPAPKSTPSTPKSPNPRTEPASPNTEPTPDTSSLNPLPIKPESTDKAAASDPPSGAATPE